MVSAIQLLPLQGTERNGITCKEILKSSFGYMNWPCLFCAVVEAQRVIFSEARTYPFGILRQSVVVYPSCTKNGL